ncbi:MAG: hypothetical protein F6K36_05645 [Symploca sp. SIO3C6]|uniref:Uncharacterized protein n=1 Tax=Symploca sp. SIO1C4 TaxID=2607765 RepID=A0A6B3NI73_9CYAN|nr:hypothetical protein [Symploca sp. SIO3C6]NER29351.1 hypothetical protein [Symploca sp. SIO1C4]NET07323.1 hypothetical protein [Symploca sp. SIO2B6]
MNQDGDLGLSQLQIKLQALAADLRCLADSYQGNSLALLALLRTLEQTHREIREHSFQASLPDNRQQLYALLKDIEEEGGWPYIERMRLRELLENMPLDNSIPNSGRNRRE